MLDKSQINIEIPDTVNTLLMSLNEAGYLAYCVGGCVRDSLLGLTPNDWDITTSAKPEEVEQLFKLTYPTGKNYGTVTVAITDNSGNCVNYEVTTFRAESNYSDGRHPDYVSFDNKLEKDIIRRDFTINSLAYNPTIGLIDLVGGVEDLKNGLIKAVGDPSERFKEDPLRVLRAIRFALRFNFEIEENTLKEMFKAKEILDTVSKERIHKELVEILSSTIGDCYNKNILITQYAKLFPILVEIILGSSIDINAHVIYINSTDYKLKLADMLRQTNYEIFKIEEILRNLKFSNYEVRRILNYVKVIYYTKTYVKSNGLISSDKLLLNLFKKLISITDESTLLGSIYYLIPIIINGNFDTGEDKLIDLYTKACIEPKYLSDLAIRGSDLVNMGYCGTIIGDKLQELLDEVIENPELNTRDQLLSMV